MTVLVLFALLVATANAVGGCCLFLLVLGDGLLLELAELLG